MLRDYGIFYWWEKRGIPTSLVTHLHSPYFHSRFVFYISEEGKKSTMDHLERKGRILVALALYWCLYMIVQHVLDMQALASHNTFKLLHERLGPYLHRKNTRM
jgi:hypothetical protein